MDPQAVYEDVVSRERYCTIATASTDGTPQAATVFFAEKGGVFYFSTQTDYRKYANLKENPRAALVITSGVRTVQLEGTVDELEDPSVAIAALDGKRGKPSRFAKLPQLRYFRLRPAWVRVLVDPGPPSRFHAIL